MQQTPVVVNPFDRIRSPTFASPVTEELEVLIKGRHPVLDLQSLLFQQLQVLLTLFSESFASFPCGTCALSVSHREYLALGGVYHPHSGCTLKQPDSMTADPLMVLSTHPSPFVVSPYYYGNLTLFVYPPFHVDLELLDRAGPSWARHFKLQFLVTFVLTYADVSYFAKLAHAGCTRNPL